jgi:hypothetical protein
MPQEKNSGNGKISTCCSDSCDRGHRLFYPQDDKLFVWRIEIVKNRWWLSALVAIFLASGVSMVFSKNKHRDEDRDRDKAVGEKVREFLPPSQPVFSHEDVVLIGDWYRHGKGLPPGLAKREHLPPGIEKHLIKGGTLPPGLMKKAQPLPIVIERRLYVLPTGYRRVVIGGNIVIMNEKTALVYDVMRLVIP